MPVGFPDYYGGLTLPVTVPEGGTGQTSITANALVYGAGTSKLVETNVGTAGQVCMIDATTLVPTFGDFDLSTATITGILPIANGGTGTATPGLVAGNGISISGSWPDQTITNSQYTYFSAGILAIAHGGTGSASPALVAGTAISITGSWPNQTIANTSNYASLADPLPVAHGGTGTTTPALVAGTAISITGSWPNQTIKNTSAYATLADPLPVAHGGTGTATPALVAGSNISISGSWPNNTVAVSNPPTFAGLTTSSDITFSALDHSIVANSVNCLRFASSGNVVLSPPGSTSGVYLAYDQGSDGVYFCDGASGTPAHISSAGRFTTYKGITLVGDGIPYLRALDDLTGQTTSTGTKTLLSSAPAGMYRLNMALYVHITSGATGTVASSVTWTQNGHTFTQTLNTQTTAATGYFAASTEFNIYIDSATNIEYAVTVTGSATFSYDIHTRLEKI